MEQDMDLLYILLIMVATTKRHTNAAYTDTDGVTRPSYMDQNF